MKKLENTGAEGEDKNVSEIDFTLSDRARVKTKMFLKQANHQPDNLLSIKENVKLSSSQHQKRFFGAPPVKHVTFLHHHHLAPKRKHKFFSWSLKVLETDMKINIFVFLSFLEF